MLRNSPGPLRGSLLLLPFLLAAPAVRAASPGAGSFRELVSRRLSVGAVRGGLAFELTWEGPSSVPAPSALEVPGGNGPLRVLVERPVLEAGRFSATVRLSNETGLPLSGLRLDVAGASIPGTGPEVPLRDLGNPGAAPLWFGELGTGQTSAPVLWQVDGELPDGTKGIVVRGVVTGASVVSEPDAAGEAARALRGRKRPDAGCTAEVLSPLRGDLFGQVAEPIGCRTDPAGILWVIDLAGDPLKLYDGRSGFLRALGPAAGAGAADVAFGAGGRVFVYEAGERPGTGIFLRALRPF